MMKSGDEIDTTLKNIEIVRTIKNLTNSRYLQTRFLEKRCL